MSLFVKAAMKLLKRETSRAGAKRLFSRNLRPIEGALNRWALMDTQLSKAVSRMRKGEQFAGSSGALESLMGKAMDSEQALVQALRRAGVERTRMAQMAKRIKSLSPGSTKGGKLLRKAVRQREGTFQTFAHGVGGTSPKDSASFWGKAGPEGYPGGAVKMAMTRDAPADLAVFGHELGHGFEQIRRAGGPETAEFSQMVRDLGQTARQVPYRKPGSRMADVIASRRAQATVGSALPPSQVQPLGEVAPHGPEEQFADLMATLLDPKARKRLPYQAKVSLAKYFPNAFPELIEAGVKLRNQRVMQGLRRGR